MPRAAKACSFVDCPHAIPPGGECPNPDHRKVAWAGSTRRTRTVSGHRQQKRSRFVILRDEGICHVCGDGGADEADHVIPLGEGGEDHIDNMKAIHSTPCHAAKTQAEAQRARTGR